MTRVQLAAIAFALFCIIGCKESANVSETLLPATPAAAVSAETKDSSSYSGKVVAITDGDTIRVLVGTEQHRVRIEGIDCPEMKGQPFSNAAKKFTSSFCFDKVVSVKVKDVDRYGRDIARVLVNGKDLSAELVAAGLAWHYKKYSDDNELAKLENQARADRTGIWSDDQAVAPWEWRKLSKEERSKF